MLTADRQFTLRPVQPGDEDLLYRIYASTRAEELAPVNWTDEQKETFLRMQFNAQTVHYLNYFPNAEYQIIQRQEGIPAGRLITDRSEASIFLIDVALLPEHRQLGIGTNIMKSLLEEAVRKNEPIILHVETFNPARKLYERLGFIKTGETGIYHEMTWTPGGKSA